MTWVASPCSVSSQTATSDRLSSPFHLLTLSVLGHEDPFWSLVEVHGVVAHQGSSLHQAREEPVSFTAG